jgi:hypothetical protein
MNMGSIVIKEGEHLIPDDALTVIFKKYSKGSGLVIPNEGELVFESSRSAHASMAEALEDVNNTQCPLKANTAVYYFTNYPDKLVATDEQPFICIADKKEDGSPDPMVMCFIDGDLDDSFEPDASGHTREYMAANTYLAPKLQRLYAQVADDLEDFLKQLEDPLLKRELMGTLFSGTGDLVLIAASGEVFTFGVKSNEKSFDWGWMSDSCGYGEVPDKETLDQTITNNAKTVLSNLRNKGVLATLKAGAAAVTGVKPDTSNEPAMVWAKPPKHIRSASNNKRKTAYERAVAVVPLDWKNCPAVLMSVEKVTKEGWEIVDAPKPTELPDGVHAVPDKKSDTAPHHIPEGPSSSVLLIPPTQQAYITDEFLKGAKVAKTLDANSQSIPNPAGLASEEIKGPTFCEKAGLLGLEATFRWDPVDLLPLFKNAPEAALRLYMDTRFAYINNLSEKPKALAPVSAASSAAAAPATSGVPALKRRRM